MKTFKSIILGDLKAQGLHSIAQKIKSITYQSYSGGDSVRVKALNLFKSEREALKVILSTYEEGNFNAMEDIYEYKKGPTQKERTAKYVFLDNEFSPEVKEMAKLTLSKDWSITDNDTAKAKMNCWYDDAQWKIIQELETA